MNLRVLRFFVVALSFITMDSIKLEIYRSLYTSVAEEMGVSLRRTAFSPNIKERRDYSCAVFDRRGRLIAQGDHMPVHLGSMPMSVRAAIEHCEMGPGDVVILNDPYAGGTHLPDVTVVAPVYGTTGDRGQGTGDKGTGRPRGVSDRRKVSASPRLPVSPSPPPCLPLSRSSPLLRRQSRASRGHWRRDAGFDGGGHGNLSGRDSDSADSDRARRRA